jgi:membrane protease YdiL (CAAX protease family)
MTTTSGDSEPSPAPVPTDGPPVSIPPERTEGQLWAEVLVVLAVGVIPYLSSAAVCLVTGPQPGVPYWLDALDRCVRSACVSGVVLYLIGRSGEGWKTFGIVRPRPLDLLLALVLIAGDLVLWVFVVVPTAPETAGVEKWVVPPRTAVEHLWVVMESAASGFSEELVMRAYLITRLERLLGSRAQAVVGSALLFASYHLYYGPHGVFEVAVKGLFYGVAYLAVRRLWPFALAHAGWNVLAILAYS